MTTEGSARLGLLASALALATLLFVGAGVPEKCAEPLVYLMGCVLLMVGVRQSYAKSTAESELIKQYEFMHRIFHNARRRIDDGGDRRGAAAGAQARSATPRSRSTRSGSSCTANGRSITARARGWVEPIRGDVIQARGIRPRSRHLAAVAINRE